MHNILKTFSEYIQAHICLHLNRELSKNCSVLEDASVCRYCSKCFFLLMYANKFDIFSLVTLRALAFFFKSTHVPRGGTLIHILDHNKTIEMHYKRFIFIIITELSR